MGRSIRKGAGRTIGKSAVAKAPLNRALVIMVALLLLAVVGASATEKGELFRGSEAATELETDAGKAVHDAMIMCGYNGWEGCWMDRNSGCVWGILSREMVALESELATIERTLKELGGRRTIQRTQLLQRRSQIKYKLRVLERAMQIAMGMANNPECKPEGSTGLMP